MLNDNANDNSPTLPANMVTIIIILPAIDSEEVMPMLKPTVANALMVSKMMVISGLSPSLKVSINITIKTKVAEKINMLKAFSKMVLGMLRSPNVKFLFPLIIPHKATKIITNVEVFIPPPVEPEDAPMNIKKSKMNKVGVFNAPMSTELKPAVLVVVLWKIEVMAASTGFIPFKALSYSNK